MNVTVITFFFYKKHNFISNLKGFKDEEITKYGFTIIKKEK